MEPGNSEQLKPQEGWQNETEIRRESIVSFLQKSDRSQYDHICELHFSGTHPAVNRKITDGTAQLLEVSVLYENGKEKQIHVVFDGEGTQNIDVYLQEKALEDYLNA
jgi:hypothetical protein